MSVRRKLIMLDMKSFMAGVGVEKAVLYSKYLGFYLGSGLTGELMRLSLSLLTMTVTPT